MFYTVAGGKTEAVLCVVAETGAPTEPGRLAGRAELGQGRREEQKRGRVAM